MNITLITPTGGRGEAFSLCERWISNQTIQPSEWLVVDDCSATKRTLFTRGQQVVDAPKQWTPNINTQRYNMDVLLERVTGDYVFVIEDDEYYAPTYLESMVKLLQTNDIVGLSNSQYYHLKVPGYKYMGNYKHASLCHTGITIKAWELLYQAVHSGQYYFDIELWKYVQEKRLKSCLISESNLSIGIKGMPGKKGLGTGHDKIGYYGDDSYSKLKEWLRDDWVFYKNYLKS